ncbi:helicase-exonuclease AddAB subunit AddA [Apilactobacillus xinyiensis]|uniref:helicase-exonuclease AddAB subunit AddA n=1 Tax=Apilactobacillus xinyiensis TaxID=2841032 RepID=UPI00200BAC23|nr:helicase-exonuclease AddAB subunit AddA [Apilactobacillus xinyiensis]MCL0330716.1 helicase-exonuclease AddAB subunit AddA [Apilactobacillus xinyiensis]
MQYTESQEKAVYNQYNGNVLVSASAGSGKTRVLVDRVINKLINQNVSIDELLIVTFTRAAAKEMRERIQTALRQKLKNSKKAQEKLFLLKQLRKLPIANISTLDAFCQTILQRYYYIINLDPEFRVMADQTEIAMLRDQVWEQVREDFYANDADKSFAQLTANFSNDRSDDGLTNLVFKVYDYANVNKSPHDWLTSTIKRYEINNNSIVKSDFYQKHLLNLIQTDLKQIELTLKSAVKISKNNGLAKEIQMLNNDILNLENFAKALNTKAWDEIRKQFYEIKFAAFPRVNKTYEDNEKDSHKRVKTIRDAAKKNLEKMGNEYFALTEADNINIMQQSRKLISKLIQVIEKFSQEYQMSKVRRHAFEFIDIEHYALDILSNQSEIAKNVRNNLINQFDEIMVDEYQDNNNLQDAILRTIAKDNPSNMFMVGDVKQSIYRFRLADPSMFIKRMHNYKKTDNSNAEITLSENFRSTKEIDRFINLIFEQIMDNKVGEIDYTGPAKLVAGAKYYPEELKSTVDVLIYESFDETEKDNNVDNNQFEVSDSAHGQVELIAQKINQLVGTEEIFDRKTQVMRPIKYSDIAVLSATRNNNLIMSDIFDRYNIPVQINGAQSYFKTTEIQIMVSLLSIIDNPYQDIPLVAVLRSPIVGLDENQLAYLRINSKTGDYYSAVLNFYNKYSTMQHTDFADQVFEKVKMFLEDLNHFRDVAQQQPLVDLIWDIYLRTGFLDYVGGMPGGKQRQANLHALYDRAEVYEQSNFKGLFQFIRFVKRMQSQNNDLDEANAETNDNVVSVMTIHGSKGLEFPVVFLADVAHGFNLQDTLKPYVLNDHLGLGVTYLDPVTRVKKDTLQRQMIVKLENRSTLAEEMRKLYVALTRAEQKLYVVGATKEHNSRKKILDAWSKAGSEPDLVLDASLRSDAKSYLDWIGLAIFRHGCFKETDTEFSIFQNDKTKFNFSFVSKSDLSNYAKLSGDNELSERWLSELNSKENVNSIGNIDRIMDFKYNNKTATLTTAYQSVSEIKRVFEDPDNLRLGEYINNQNDNQANRYVKNDFKQPEFLQSNVKPQATEIGTATHLVLQKINLNVPVNFESVHELVVELVSQKNISSEVANKINIHSIVNFFNDKLGTFAIEHKKDFHREVPFSLLINANQIFEGFNEHADEKVLIHGIIDGYIELENEVILFDYKTDYVNNNVNQILNKYRGQINLYAIALEHMLNKRVSRKFIHLLNIDKSEQI